MFIIQGGRFPFSFFFFAFMAAGDDYIMARKHESNRSRCFAVTSPETSVRSSLSDTFHLFFNAAHSDSWINPTFSLRHDTVWLHICSLLQWNKQIKLKEIADNKLSAADVSLRYRVRYCAVVRIPRCHGFQVSPSGKIKVSKRLINNNLLWSLFNKFNKHL